MWCRPKEIGQDAGIEHVEAVSQVFKRPGLEFYRPSETWELDPFVTQLTLEGNLRLSLLRNVIGFL